MTSNLVCTGSIEQMIRIMCTSVLLMRVVGGCVCADFGVTFPVRGTLVDAVSDKPLAGVTYAGQLFCGGDRILPEASGFPPSGADGSFAMDLGGLLGGICSPFPVANPMIRCTRPDQIEVIVIRDNCEQRILIDITEETVEEDVATESFRLRRSVPVPPC
jgi:hypothetical protein